VLDAQFFGLAQRRRRVFIVGCLGDWRSAAAILFELGGTVWDNAPSREQEQEDTCGDSGGVDGRRPDVYGLCLGSDPLIAKNVAQTLTRRNGDPSVIAFAQNTRDEVRLIGGDGGLAGALCANVGAKQQTYVLIPRDIGDDDLVAPGTADGARDADANAELPLLQGERAIAFSQNQNGDILTGDIMHALTTNTNATGRNSPTVAVSGFGREQSMRKLMPVESERLQGFPDGYTNVSFRGKPAFDGPRQSALGNSFPVTVVRWIGTRVQSLRERGWVSR